MIFETSLGTRGARSVCRSPAARTNMSDQKKAPQLFHSDLFSSPGGSSSSGLSLGFDETFSSPFSLAPASRPDGEGGELYLEISH